MKHIVRLLVGTVTGIVMTFSVMYILGAWAMGMINIARWSIYGDEIPLWSWLSLVPFVVLFLFTTYSLGKEMLGE